MSIHPAVWERTRNILAFPHGWQRPAKTEEWAYERCLAGLPDNRYIQILCFPWATLIDLLRKGETVRAQFYINALRCCFPKTTLIRATVIQHIYAKDMLPFFEQLGITDVFWSHATESETVIGKLRIHPFPLYPASCVDGLTENRLPPNERRYLYSFIGAYEPGLYLTEARRWIFDLPPRNDAYLARRGEWHFESAVYRGQIGAVPQSEEALLAERGRVKEYTEVLGQSVFSLCPSGSGPNSIRLWESLGMGTIPVIISDTHRLPGEYAQWTDAVIFADESKEAIDALPARLEQIRNSLNDVDSRQNLLRELWNRHCLSPEQDISDTLTKILSAMTKKEGVAYPESYKGASPLKSYWTEDSKKNPGLGVAVYRPTLRQPSAYISKSPPLCAEPFEVRSDASELDEHTKLDCYFGGALSFDAESPSILICAHSAGKHLFGGERSFLDMLDAAGALGTNIYVTVPQILNDEYLDEIRKRTSGVYCFLYSHWTADVSPSPSVIERFKSIIRNHTISIVHSNTIMLREPLIAAKVCGVLSFIHVRELIHKDFALLKHIGLPAVDISTAIIESADYLIANSKTTFSEIGAPNRTFIAPNVARVDELDIENNVTSDRVIFGLLSSNIPKKGIFELVKIAKLCEKTAPNAVFAFIGPDGPDKPDLQEIMRQVKAGELPNNIVFLGYKSTPLEAVSEVNVVLNLSLFAESFGRSVAEALASRRPVIAYNWGALPELVINEITGFIVPYQDVQAVADCVVTLSRNPALIERMGKAGRTHIVKNYSPEKLAMSIRSVYIEAYAKKLDKSSESHGVDIHKEILHAAQKNYSISFSSLARSVAIIIPVFNAIKFTIDCIESVLRYTDFAVARIIIINDGSTDPTVETLLNKYKDHPKIRILNNDKNIGYTKTVNRGILEAGTDDVVLLNSDTIVTPGWLFGLRIAAYAKDNVGTVTAMGNNAGAFSFPEPGIENKLLEGFTHEQQAKAIVAGCLNNHLIELPTGNGFCLYIRKKLFNKIGLFDEVSFPRGYGEENDFCMRALKAEFVNVLTPWSYVFHVRSASFKGEKEKLIQDGEAALRRLHPEYMHLVKDAFSQPALLDLRRSAAEALRTASKSMGTDYNTANKNI